MANLATKAPNFTRENAAEMARRATASRIANREREKQLARQALVMEQADAGDEARKKRVMRQIARCDELLEDTDDPETFVKLTSAKERLWNLVFPKAGVNRPRQSSRRNGATPQPVVVEPETPNPV